jgi:hypothetical protein
MKDNPQGPFNDEELLEPIEYEELPIPEEYEELPVSEEYEELPIPVEYEESPGPARREEPPGPPRNRPPRKARGKRRKLLGVAFGVLAAVAVVFWVFNQSIGQGAVDTGVSTHRTSTPIPTPAPATPTPIVRVRGTPVGPNTIAPGALILLNPGIVRQGTSMGVNGSGFDPRATVDLAVKQRVSSPGQVVGFVRADKYGNFYDNLTVPDALSSGTFFVEASERGSTKVARAAGVVAGGTPQLKLGTQVGKPGDMITVSVHGFSPGETIKVYWNTMSGDPVAKLQADGGGGIGQGSVQVPFGAAGINTFLFVGAKSQSMVAATFYLLSLYPTIKLSSYAVRADNPLSFSGKGFGPGERVLVFLNSAIGQPLAVVQATQYGTFANAGGFVIPFGLKGRQAFIFLGEESRASVAVSWTVLPYMPNAQASTYGGLPGTTVTFYATGFAKQEVVHVYVGHTHDNSGNMVSCFRTDDKGNAASAGSYVVPGDAQGKLVFGLTGSKSGGTATATMNVTPAPSAVQVPKQPPFTCPLDNATK